MTRPPFLQRISSVIQLGWRLHGVRLPFVVIQRCWCLVRLRLSGPQLFEFEGEKHPYHFHHYSLDNERVVEVALARDFLLGKTGEILEVGNVLSHHLDFPHDVVDKYEVAPGVLNEDIVDYTPTKKYAGIVSISTLEHVGWDEQPRDSQKIVRAIAHLKTLLTADGWFFVTIPLAYNPHVDELLRKGKSGFSEIGYLLRISKDNRWRQATWEEVRDAKYGSPFPCANAVFVGIYRNN